MLFARLSCHVDVVVVALSGLPEYIFSGFTNYINAWYQCSIEAIELPVLTNKMLSWNIWQPSHRHIDCHFVDTLCMNTNYTIMNVIQFF